MKKALNFGYDCLYRLAMWSAHHPKRVIAVSIALFLLSVAYTVAKLDFKTSRNDLVQQNEPAVQRFKEISEDFGRITNVIVVVEGNDLDRMKDFAVQLAKRLKQEPQYFGNIFYRLDTSSLEGKKLLFLSPKELEDLRDKLKDYNELIEELAFEPSLATILRYVNQKISEATVSHIVKGFLGQESDDKKKDGKKERDPVDLSFLRSLLTELKASLEPNYRFHSPWDTFFKASKRFSYDGFLVSDDERFLYITLEAKSQKKGFTKKKAPLDRLRAHIKELRAQSFADISAGVTGGVALATDEMSRAMTDTKIATIVAIIGITLLFIVVFRQVHNPFLAMVTLIMSLGWTFGWLTLTVGYLNILSVTFTPILLGLGVDFGIHILARFIEERERGLECIDSIHHSVAFTGKAVILGALTTAFAFFALMLARFRGIQELGFIVGCGVLFSLLATFTVLPALMSMMEKCLHSQNQKKRLAINLDFPFLTSMLRHYRIIEGATLIVTVFALFWIPRVHFDYNLLKLQARGTESVVWEEKIIGESGRSSWFAVTTADNIDELRLKHAAFEKLPAVRKVDSLADLLPEDQQRRIDLVHSIKPYVPDMDLGNIEPESVDLEELIDLLEKIKFKLRSDTKWDPAKKPSEQEIAATRKALLEALDTLKSAPQNENIRSKLRLFEKKLFEDFGSKFDLLRNNVDPPGPIRESDIPVQLLSRFKGKSGRYLIQIYSRKNIWEKENMEEFVRELRSVDPQVTGSPVVGYIAIRAMQKGYLEGSIYAFSVILLVLILSFRRPSHVLYAVTPLAITVIWTLGFMGLFDIPFNLANVIAMPLVLGIVVDDGIHITHRYLERDENPYLAVKGGIGRAISLTSWTTMIGFGSLMLARHYGIFTLGVLVTVSVGIAWFISLIGLPSMLVHINVARKKAYSGHN